MPDTMEENETIQRTRTLTIAVWWNKFHFSGRVIMCSVLFGLGVILIGGLIFAINLDDDSNKPELDNALEPLPRKPPSRYVGPVVMGIGSFIVVVGVIMCLFETQVCRKKSGDSKPLMSDTGDMEGKGSDSLAVPSSSHGHRNHKHGNKKKCASPKKSRSKHGKELQKNSCSPKSPPIFIDQSKNFMTSSEDKFLTPPNIPDTALVHRNSDSASNQDSISLMKSFTSSDPSWTKSSEFLTPTASFKDKSSLINSSIEVDEKCGQVNFRTSEFMTPLTVEEDRIQKLLVRVKNEQKEATKIEMEKEASEIISKSENDILNSSENQTEIVKENQKEKGNVGDKKDNSDNLPAALQSDEPYLNNNQSNTNPNCLPVAMLDDASNSKDINETAFSSSSENTLDDVSGLKDKKEMASTGNLPLDTLDDALGLGDSNLPQRVELKNVSELEEKENTYEDHSIKDKCSKDNIHTEICMESKQVGTIKDVKNDDNSNENPSVQNDETKNDCESDISASKLDDGNKQNSNHHLYKETTGYETSENDLENSASLNKTVVSPDNLVEKSKNKGEELMLKESLCTDNDSESFGETKSEDNCSGESSNIPSSTSKSDEARENEFSYDQADSQENKPVEILSTSDSR